MTYQCTPKILCLVAILLIVIIFAKQIFITLPMLKLLFTDQISFILVSILCIFVLLYDLQTGIILSIIVIILGLNISAPISGNVARFSNVATSNRNYASASELFYNKTGPAPNGNLPPFQIPESPMKQTPNGMIPINSNDASSKSCQEPDFITRTTAPARDGYDVVGCPYDMKESLQNLTNYGPPLAQCSAYSDKSFSCNGTLFYPLNA
jgi:hypothetical protein